MVEREKPSSDTGTTGRGIDRRTILKGAAVAGLGASTVGTASAKSGGTAGDLPNTLLVRATGVIANYEFTVSGDVALGPNSGGGEDRIIGRDTATGTVAGRGTDDFTFSGQVTEFDADAPVDVFVNGRKVDDPVGLPATGLPHTVTIEGRGDRTVNYAIEVTGSVEPGEDADDGDRIRGRTVRGAVAGGGVDSFHFSGSIALDTDGPVSVAVDIEE